MRPSRRTRGEWSEGELDELVKKLPSEVVGIIFSNRMSLMNPLEVCKGAAGVVPYERSVIQYLQRLKRRPLLLHAGARCSGFLKSTSLHFPDCTVSLANPCARASTTMARTCTPKLKCGTRPSTKWIHTGLR